MNIYEIILYAKFNIFYLLLFQTVDSIKVANGQFLVKKFQLAYRSANLFFINLDLTGLFEVFYENYSMEYHFAISLKNE